MSPLNLARLGPLLAALLLAACGGGSGTSDPAAPVARVEILSASAWLAGMGQTRELAARAFDADGNPVNAAITWSSSRPVAVAVDANGRLTAAVAAGSAQISAQAGGVSSAPLLAYVATPAPGVVLVDDTSIVGQLVETDPAAPPSLANTYQVTLSGIAPPAVGTLLLGRGDKPLAGKVTAVTTAGAQSMATLRLVPLAELFADLAIEEIFDLSRAEVLIPGDVQAQFNVARSGNTWSFTPKPVPASQRARALAVTGTHARDILPFRSCEASLEGYDELSNLPIGLEPPTFGITLSPSLDVRYDRQSGLTRFVVSAEPKVTMGATLQASVPIKGEMKCLLQLLALRLPIGGPLAFFIGGMVPVGVGFELKATVTLATFKIGAQSEIGTKLSGGWNCSGPTCEFVRSIDDASATLTPVFDAPNPTEDARLESELNLFGYLEAELGNPFLRSLRFKAFEERIGAEFKGNFAPLLAQVLDTAYAADYALSVKGEAKLGTGINDIVTLLGLGSLTSIDLDIERELASSPKALTIEADRATFTAGDTVNTKVTLDPATLNFLGIYNVDSVQLRRSFGLITEVLATQTASAGQQVFDFSVTAPNVGKVSDWTAFVTTRLLPFELASLELGAVQSDTGIVVVRDFNLTSGGCEASAHSKTNRFPVTVRDDTLPAACNATYAGARASVNVAPVVTGPSLVIGEEVQNDALAFSFYIEISPEQQVAQPSQEVAWVYGAAQAQRESVFRVGAETRMGVSLDYTATGGGRLQPGNGVTVRRADGTVREAFVPGQTGEVVLHPGDTVRVYVGIDAHAGVQSDPFYPDWSGSATVQANVVLRFNP